MAKSGRARTIGNVVAPARFLAFLGIFAVAAAVLAATRADWRDALMGAFDLAGVGFLASCITFFAPTTPARMREEAERNDANRVLTLVVTCIVMLVVLVTVAAEIASGRGPLRGAFVIGTLGVAWLFSNTVFALHYAHLYYGSDGAGEHRRGLQFNATPDPDYWDFFYFSVTLGMTFQTSDVDIASRDVRRVATFHCLAAFVYNLGVLAFTISLLSGGASAS